VMEKFSSSVTVTKEEMCVTNFDYPDLAMSTLDGD
jgi:hypothetical protein